MMQYQDFFSLDPRLLQLAQEAEKDCQAAFSEIEQTADYNGAKVLAAFQKHRVSEACFYGSTGYGYGDQGRDTLDKVWATVFGAEDALVRHQFVSGTHTISVALFGILRPNDRIVFLTGKPYDTLEEVIGISGTPGKGSLTDFGVQYELVDLLPNGTPNYDAIPEAVKGAKVAYVQRSRGYSLRPALTIAQIERMVQLIRSSNPDAIIMVDNCYGEFVEIQEPTQVGCDLIIGSLIKNPGGGIARTGGYIAGKADLVELCANRLTCVGMGKEVGCSLQQSREMFLGLFHAPSVVGNARKTITFAAALFGRLGFPSYPAVGEPQGDIVVAIQLGSAENLIAFCQGIQPGSPVDSYVTPAPWDMPGYSSPVIMAAGTFTLGASVELSADAPLREPYAVWMQGGITETSGKIGVLLAAQSMLEKGLLPYFLTN